jgi:hypothetical protein
MPRVSTAGNQKIRNKELEIRNEEVKKIRDKE